MADEKKTNETVTETPKAKKGILSNIITGIVCLVVGAGLYCGADATIIQKTIDESLAKQVIADVTATTVADTIAEEGIVSVVITDEKKAEITAKEVEKNTSAWQKIVEDAKAAVKVAKEAAKDTKSAVDTVKEDVKEVVEEVKEKVEGTAAPAADAAAAATTDVKKD